MRSGEWGVRSEGLGWGVGGEEWGVGVRSGGVRSGG